MSSQVSLKALGLNYSPNTLALPEGSLVVANDVIVRRDNVIESRRGFKEYSQTFGATTDHSKQLISYKDRILNHYSNILQYDTGVVDSNGKAIFANFAGSYTETETGLRIKSIEANKNLYFTTDKGIKKISARTASDFTTASGFIKDAGAVKALDFTATLNLSQGQSTGFLGNDSAVAYRIVWGYKDLNDNLILGAPSDSVSVYNYLSNVVPLDMNAFLVMLDNLVQSNATYYSAFHNITTNGTTTFPTTDTFSGKFGVNINDDASTYATNLVNTATYMDKFALLADTNAVSTTKPLQINTATGKGFSATTGTATIDFTSDPSTTFSVGDYIEITGAADLTGSTYTFPINKRYSFTLSPGAGIPANTVLTSNSQTFTTISRDTYVLTVTPGQTASFGAQYTVGGNTYSVISTLIAGASVLFVTGSVPPPSSGSLVYSSGTGTGPIAYSAVATPSSTFTFTITTATPTASIGAVYRDAALNQFVVLTGLTTTGTTLYCIGTTTPSASPLTLYAGTGTASLAYSGVTSLVLTAGTGSPTSGGVTTGNLVGTSTYPFTGFSQADPSASVGAVYSNNSQTFTVTAFDSYTTLTTTGTGTPLSSSILTKVSGTGDANLVYPSFSVNTLKYSSFNNTTTGTTPHPSWQITTVDSTNKKIQFSLASTDTITVGTPGTATQIVGYNYRHIVNTSDAFYTTPLSSLVVSTPPTDEQLNIIEHNISRIVTRIKAELTGVVSTALKTAYVNNYYTTSAANVDLTITIPTTITNNPDYFLQVYRTRNFTCTANDVLGVNVTPDDEMRLVYEAFPTTAEFAAGYLSFQDTYPEELRNSNVNLYTNPVTGEGISQANDIPPIAKDINRFKNVVFYANTSTRHRLNPFQLLGTSGITAGDMITISDGTTIGTQNYQFVDGVAQLTNIVFAGTVTPAGVAGKYFNIYSAQDLRAYYIWYRTDNTTGTDPAVTGKVGVRVDVLTGDSNTVIRNKTLNVLNSLSLDFIPSVYNTYTFTCSSAPTVTAGDTYTDSNNSTYKVISAVTTTLICSGTTDPAASGNLTKVTGSGTSPIAYTSVATTTIGLNILNTETGATTDASNGTPAITGMTITTPADGVGEQPSATPPKVLLIKTSDTVTASQAIDQTARSLVRVINENVNSPVNAYYISSSTSLPGQINLESKVLANIPFYVEASSVATGASFNPNIEPYNVESSAYGARIDRISASVVKFTTQNVVGHLLPHGLVNGDNIMISLATVSSTTQYLNGIYQVTRIDDYSFTVNATTSAFTSGAYNFAWSKLSDISVSNNESKPNRVYYSKLLQPEAVPLLNYFNVGSEDKQILRIFPLRDSLFVFKEDGLYRISGENAPFVVTLFDTSCVLIAADTLSIANNIIYGWTNKGISNVTEAGVTEVSRPIDTVILKLASANYVNFPHGSWGLGYDSDNSYTVYACAQPEDIQATIGFRFSNLTNTWTNFDRSQTCGVVNLKDDKIYTGSGTYNLIDQERKNFDRTDYADRDFNVNLINNAYNLSQQKITLSSVSDIIIGDVVTQTQGLSVYKLNAFLDKLDLDDNVGQYGFTIPTLGSTTVVVNVFNVGTGTPANHNLATGDWINIDLSNASPDIVGEYQITYINATSFSINIAYPLVTAATGTANIMTRNYSKTFASVPGDNLRTKILNIASYLDTDPNLTSTSYVSTISSYSGNIASVTAASAAIITKVSHGLVNDRVITISGTDSNLIPQISGTYSVTVLNANQFAIPLTVTTGDASVTPGTLTFSTAPNLESVNDIAACFNQIVNLLNNPSSGTSFKNYKTITESTLFEAVILDVDRTHKMITINLPLQLTVGVLTIYKAIPCEIQYSPITFGDPLQLKQVYEATMMFASKAFTQATASFSSDLKPEFTSIDFYGQGNGMFGHYSNPGFGYGFFGGASNSAPFRTIIPREAQRCRYINVRFDHHVAREIWNMYGITLTKTESNSTRAYR